MNFIALAVLQWFPTQLSVQLKDVQTRHKEIAQSVSRWYTGHGSGWQQDDLGQVVLTLAACVNTQTVLICAVVSCHNPCKSISGDDAGLAFVAWPKPKSNLFSA